MEENENAAPDAQASQESSAKTEPIPTSHYAQATTVMSQPALEQTQQTYAQTGTVPPPAGQPTQSGAVPPPPCQPIQPGQPGIAGQPGMPGVPGQQPSPTGSLVCGILAIVFCWIPLVGIVLGIIAIVLAGKYFKAGGTLSQGKAGRICGIIGLVLAIILLIINGILAFTRFSAIMDDRLKAMDVESARTYIEKPSSSSASSSSLDEADAAAEAAVTAKLDGIKNQDPTAIAEIATIAESTFNESFASYSELNITMQTCGINPTEFATAMTEGFDYKPDFVSTIDGEGTAFFDVTIRDMSSIMMKLSSDLDFDSLSGMPEDEAKQAIGAQLMDIVAQTQPKADQSFTVDVEESNGTWVVNADDWEDELEYFFGF